MMSIKRDPINHGLDRRIQQLNDQYQKNTGNHHRSSERADVQPTGQRNQQRGKQGFLTEGVFMCKGRSQPGH